MYTDHKPLLAIFNKAMSNVTPRLQRLLIRLNEYDVKLEYKQGKDMVLADPLSRVSNHTPVGAKPVEGLNITIEEIQQGTDISMSKVEKIRQRTLLDDELQELRTVVENGWPLDRNRLPECI